MLLAIGSTNKVKIDAVRELIQEYPLLSKATVTGFPVSSEISEQPMSLEETIQGAKNRAKNVFSKLNCDYGIGLESGLIQAPGTETGYLEACVCSIYNGETHSLGISSGFEIPPPILDLILNKKMTLNEACFHSAISQDPNLGSSSGLIGLLTKGKLTRKEYTKQCFLTALIQIENKDLYSGIQVSK